MIPSFQVDKNDRGLLHDRASNPSLNFWRTWVRTPILRLYLLGDDQLRHPSTSHFPITKLSFLSFPYLTTHNPPYGRLSQFPKSSEPPAPRPKSRRSGGSTDKSSQQQETASAFIHLFCPGINIPLRNSIHTHVLLPRRPSVRTHSRI